MPINAHYLMLSEQPTGHGSDMTKMWMIRGKSGQLHDDFQQRVFPALGWSQLALIQQVLTGKLRVKLETVS